MRDPINGAKVRLELIHGQRKTQLLQGQTDASGELHAGFTVPDLPAGSYHIQATVSSPLGERTTKRTVSIEERMFLRVTTDRGVYRPGSQLRYRVRALGGTEAKPIRTALKIVVKDPRGTAIFQQEGPTDAGGVLQGEVPLGEDLLFGAYEIDASTVPDKKRGRGSSIRARATVKVKRFALPPFFVKLQEKGPQRVRISVRYPNGDPLLGTIEVWADGARVVEARSDAHGELLVKVPKSATEIVARAKDDAGRVRDARLRRQSASDQLSVALMMARKRPARGAPIEVTVLTADRTQLKPATIELWLNSKRFKTVRSPGAVRVVLPATKARQLNIRAIAKAGGRTAKISKRLNLARAEQAQIQADRVVVNGDDPISITGRWTGQGPVLLTLLKDGTPLAQTVAPVEKGRLRASLRAPEGAHGLLSLNAQDLGWNRLKRGSASDALNIFARPAPLKLSVETQTKARPGRTVTMKVRAQNAAGQPAPGVHLAASAVDERVLSLSPDIPSLKEALEAKEMKRAKALGLHFRSLLGQEGESARLARRAIIESLPVRAARPHIHLEAYERYRKEFHRVSSLTRKVRRALTLKTQDRGAIIRGGRMLDPLSALVQDEKGTPWGQPTDWAYLRQLHPSMSAGYWARQVNDARLFELVLALRSDPKNRRELIRTPRWGILRLVRQGTLKPYQRHDAWGHPFATRIDKSFKRWKVDVYSAGPDGVRNTADDIALGDIFSNERGYGGLGARGSGSGGGGFATGSSGLGAKVRSGRVNIMGARPPLDAPIRKRFDETVLWTAGIVTDARGEAQFSVPLADSITTFRVSLEAVSPGGAVGTARASISTHLPVQLDVSPPGPLTVGDRYQLGVIVINHTTQPKTLRLTAQMQGSLQLEDAQSRTLTLAPGRSDKVGLWLSASSAGPARASLSLYEGDRRLDAAQYELQVLPPGRKMQSIYAAALREPRTELRFEAPKNPRSLKVELRIFKGVSEQALDSLDGLLREPHGCFEQTSSTTYPNLLVLKLLQDDPQQQEVVQRARTLVAKGYQRLISYEVAGGGFSWFGSAPANRVLTAYGLMEFVDMAKVYPVDPQLIERTQRWLLKQQRPDGAFPKDAQWLHDWSAAQGTLSTTAYIAWALFESGYRGAPLDRALTYLRKHQDALNENSYLLALQAAMSGPRALRRLKEHQTEEKEGLRVRAPNITMFSARGRAADVQVTALAASALAGAGRASDARRAFAWLWSARAPSSGWGSTQSTVLALRAAAKLGSFSAPSGPLKVALDGRPVGLLKVEAGQRSLTLPGDLAPGPHRLTLGFAKAPKGLFADLRLGWRSQGPTRGQTRGLKVQLQPTRKGKLSAGETLAFDLSVENVSAAAVPWPTAVVPIPPGFRAPIEGLDQLTRSGAIERYETLGDRLHLYLRKLEPGASRSLQYSLVAEASADVLQRGALGYAYYNPDIRGISGDFRLQTD